jgi:hypothetical protein
MTTHAILLDDLCEATGATYTRMVDGERVRLTLTLPGGDVVGATGDTTGEALQALVAKCRSLSLVPEGFGHA